MALPKNGGAPVGRVMGVMLAKRIIPCLDCKNGRVVKGIRFVNLRDAGDPAELSEMYNREGADELVMLDISASREGRDTLMETVNRVARKLFLPLTVGGGVRTLEDARRLLNAGSDKVSLNTAAVLHPELVRELAEHFGSQAIVVAIDAKRRISKDNLWGRADRYAQEGNDGDLEVISHKLFWEVYIHGGRTPTGLDVLVWAKKMEKNGAGEILLTSMDRDGTKDGYDIPLTRVISDALSIPVIASGGAGTLEHLRQALKQGRADAVLAASIFHYRQHTVGEVKKYLKENGIVVRED